MSGVAVVLLVLLVLLLVFATAVALGGARRADRPYPPQPTQEDTCPPRR